MAEAFKKWSFAGALLIIAATWTHGQQRSDGRQAELERQIAELRLENAKLKLELADLQLRLQRAAAPPTTRPTQRRAGAVKWEVHEETSIEGMVGQVELGTVFKTASGNLYEVIDPVVLVEVEINPGVLVLTDGILFKLKISGIDEPLACKKLTSAEGGAAGEIGVPPLIESRIDADFDGFEAGKIFKLRNGQVWQQTSVRYRYRYKFAPAVTIWKDGTVHRMKVDGVDDTVTVTRLR